MTWPHHKSRNKFGAKSVNGFPSKLEAAVYDLLKMREKLGEISDIRRQQIVTLQEGSRDVRITWRVDFSYVECATGDTILAEAKGFRTETYLLKLKLFRKNPQYKLEIWEGSHARPVLAEVIDVKK